MRFPHRIQQVQTILDSYKYPEPFAQHLKNYFKANPKFGSKDRKQLRELAFAYLRTGNLFAELDLDKALGLSLILTGKTELFAKEEAFFNQGIYGEIAQLPTFDERLKGLLYIHPEISKEDIFPYSNLVSEGFKNDEFIESHLEQPLVWIRIQKGKEKQVEADLKQNSIYAWAEKYLGLGFAQDTKLTELQSFQKGWFWIQDASTQSAADYFGAKENETWWDCCAGAGGKTLCLADNVPTAKIYASDLRAGVLHNLEERQKLLGKGKVETFLCNLEHKIDKDLPQFDGIVADVPCTGSGTWSRNPENLSYFDSKVLPVFQLKQLKILENIYPFLKTGKPLVYITCSVFKAENEEVIEKFCAKHKVKIDEQKYLEGYKTGAENIFLCRLIKTE